MRVLIIGGYGTFGGRLADLLALETRLRLLIAGRSRDKADAFCQGRANCEATVFDRDGDLDARLAAAAPDVVVDASGPFQTYGYSVVEACLRCGVHYLDLADATDFVAGIARYDDAARAKSLTVISGASTFPALTSAAIRKLGGPVTRVTAGIAPSPYVDVGPNVIRVIAGYAGKKIGGDYALMSARRVVIAPPGHIPLRPTRFSLVDVPDRVLLPRLYPALQSVWMGAGPKPALWHHALSWLAWLVRLRLLPSLSFLAPLMVWVINRFRWGEHRGGLFVEVDGRTWSMIAEGNEGAAIPSIAAYAILTKWLDGRPPAPGARPCTEDLEVEDYERVFAGRAIVTGSRAPEPGAPLYRNFLGSVWDRLPSPIRAMHDGTGTWTAQGRAEIVRGRSPFALIAAWLNGFPPSGRDVKVTVRFDARDGRETWTRDFDGRSFSSVQYEGRGRGAGLIWERFGPITFGIAMIVESGRLRLDVRQWRLFGVPLPGFLRPRGDTFESVDGTGRFNFHVEIGFPWTGLIVRYRGWLERVPGR
ncbi:MAG TPA: DUF4166 domain-containing protein [Rhizomicrobium sp.]|nr:DUF4166 domain-containing protein [Rhizomicrobium sp.]